MDDILKQIFGDKIVDSKFRDFEVLARVDSTNDYYFTVSKAMCNRNAEKYIFITKHIMGNPDQYVSIPIRLVDPLIDLLLHANGRIAEDLKITNYKAPIKKTLL